MLNAFRHHWNLHLQRLFPHRGQTTCSTPFGIIGIFTGDGMPMPLRGKVLNAFRHHWNLHGQSAYHNKKSLDVLNAFRHHWNLHPWVAVLFNAASRCAQRLSASLESSPDGDARRLYRRLVLNAFRHHWNLHFGGVDQIARLIYECSTPFGIIGIFTKKEDKAERRQVFVLNAFRHHWNLHGFPAREQVAFILCSTPFGIIGIFTRVRESKRVTVRRAQRLSASLESSRMGRM